MEREIKTLTDREHVLLRSAMYIGAVDLVKSYDYILIDDKIIYQELEFVPGLIKIINEIIDNSIDEAIKTDFKYSNNISVSMTHDTVSISDNGRGIPVKQNDIGEYIPRACWSKSRTGSNFDSNPNHTHIGLNGVGSFATNCFSTKFIGETDDGVKNYKVTFKNNAESFTETVGKSSSNGTKVTFTPDLKMFKLDVINETHQLIIKQRLINLSLNFPSITFKFNGKKINVNTFKKYVSLFSEHAEIVETDKYKIAILQNSEDDFRQFSYVNGLKITDGGTHIENILNGVVYGLRDKLVKKYKTIKPGDIRNKLMVIAFLKDLPNPKFNSQTKEKITNSIKEINEYYGNIDYEKLIARILKNSEIIDPITEIYKIKEELKRRQEMKSLDNKPREKIKSEKYTKAVGDNNYLLVCEGACLLDTTSITMEDFTVKQIKDIIPGDKIISGSLCINTVISKTKLIKECLKFNTPIGEIICSEKHRLYVYDTEEYGFKFEEAIIISKNIKRYNFIKSKINTNSVYDKVISNKNYHLTLNSSTIEYTANDYFIIQRNDIFMKVKGVDIKLNDLIILENNFK